MDRRRRAPRREGHRTTLTVPHSVLDAADRLARELGTTANDAIVRLAEEGASARERHEQIAALASERRAAAESVDSDKALPFPSADEFHEAMLAGRRH
jgi:phage I-like protein